MIENYAHVAKIPGAAHGGTDWYRYKEKARGISSERVTLFLDEDATFKEMQVATAGTA